MHLSENGVFIAAVAHAMVGLTLVWDKVLLKQTATQSVVNYIFWLGVVGVFGCLVGVFGMRSPTMDLLLIGLASGALDLMGSWAYYKALQSGEASQTLTIMGGFGPLATALIARPLLGNQLHGLTLWGFGLLVAGGFLMFLSQKIDVRKILPLVLLSAGFFGLSNVLQKIAFNALGFPTGFVFFSIGQFVLALLFLTRGTWRKEIFEGSKAAQPKSKAGYFVNRFFNGLGSFLVSFAVSRSDPALVSAISGLRYATVFIAAYLLTQYKPNWLRETFAGWALATKSMATVLVIAGLAVIGAAGGSGTANSASCVPGRVHGMLLLSVTDRRWVEQTDGSGARDA